MTAGTCPSRRTARAAPLPTRSRATALICCAALLFRSFVNFREKPKAALRRPSRKRPRLQGCERTRRLIRARAARRNAGSGRPPGRFKEGVFGGDKVEVLIQHLLIEADQEGGYERCS